MSVPFALSLDGCAGTEGDLAKLSELVASGARLDRICDHTSELLADPDFRRRVRAVEFALWSRPQSACEVNCVTRSER